MLKENNAIINDNIEIYGGIIIIPQLWISNKKNAGRINKIVALKIQVSYNNDVFFTSHNQEVY